MSREWIEFIGSLLVLMSSFHIMLHFGRKGPRNALIGYLSFMAITVLVLVLLCFVM